MTTETRASNRLRKIPISKIGTLMLVLVMCWSFTPWRVTAGYALALTQPGDWKQIKNDDLIYLQLPAGRVTIELAPEFAPHTIENVRRLVRQKYFDGAFIVRAQDNFVVQWAQDMGIESKEHSRVRAELERPLLATFVPLPDRDTYAPQTGFQGDFPAARGNRAEWLTHCYGMVGVGRDVAPDSGNGTELYVVIGQAPRQLDRNYTLIGRVIEGMPLLSTMPRGDGAMGFYKMAWQRTRILSVRIAADLPKSQVAALEVLRTDSQYFHDLLDSRRRPEKGSTESRHVDVCNLKPTVRRRRTP